MTCAKDGSPMRVYEEYPDAVVWTCFAAGHHVRIGAPVPVVAPLEAARIRNGHLSLECTNGKCRRPRKLPYKKCEECLASQRESCRRSKALRKRELVGGRI